MIIVFRSFVVVLCTFNPVCLVVFLPSVFPLQAHEFVDEQMYEQNCLETALQAYPSHSSSISSRDSSAGGCCGCRAKRNTPLPNASLPSTHQDPLQELSAIHIQCGDLAPHTARYS